MLYFKNKTLESLLGGYNLNQILSLKREFPLDIKKMLNDEIIINEFGIGLKSSFIPIKNPDKYGQSYYEDEHNHFHIDWYIKPENGEVEVLILGIIVLQKLAEKIENAGIRGIRFWLSFETKGMLEEFAIKNGLNEEGDRYYTSDRLSFHTKRD